MYYDESAEILRTTSLDKEILGIFQDVSLHDTAKVERLVTTLWTAIHNEGDTGDNPPSTAYGMLAADALGLVCEHSGPAAAIPKAQSAISMFGFRR